MDRYDHLEACDSQLVGKSTNMSTPDHPSSVSDHRNGLAAPDFHMTPSSSPSPQYPASQSFRTPKKFWQSTNDEAHTQDFLTTTNGLGYGQIYANVSGSSPPSSSTYVKYPLLEAIDFWPHSYVPGTRVDLRLRSSYDISAQLWQINVLFGIFISQGQVTLQGCENGTMFYVVSCISPWVSEDRMCPIALSLNIFQSTGQPVIQLPFGYIQRIQKTFIAWEDAHVATNATRKRPFSDLLLTSSAPYRPLMNHGHYHNELEDDLIGRTPSQPHTRVQADKQIYHISTPFTTVADNQDLYRPQYPEAKGIASSWVSQGPRRKGVGHPGLSRRTRALKANWKKALTPEATTSRRRDMSLSRSPSNMRLIRISTIKTNDWHTPVARHLSLNSYEHNKPAQLQLQSDLAAIPKSWTTAEKEAKRRLVEFQRSTLDDVVIANFKVVTADERCRRGVCVSCIWWEEQDETYITSVDAISLLELLVGFHLTVEEKNRIRRNLEGFKPFTVTKSKEGKESVPKEVEDFFAVIMGYDDPKPRNIEKDVKIFPWRILSKALQRIIGKFTPDYASVARDFDARTPSPAQRDFSVTSTAAIQSSIYQPNASETSSPQMPGPHSLPKVMPGPRLQVPLETVQIFGPYAYQTAPVQTREDLRNQTFGSFDYASYLNADTPIRAVMPSSPADIHCPQSSDRLVQEDSDFSHQSWGPGLG